MTKMESVGNVELSRWWFWLSPSCLDQFLGNLGSILTTDALRHRLDENRMIVSLIDPDH